ncbi:MAG: M67 family metallopeptidase [Promethearchaeota archaeon]
MVIPRVALIQLTLSHQRKLYRIRQQATPFEACALLLGTYQKQNTLAIVNRIAEMENIAKSSSTFAMDPEQQYQILSEAARDNLEQVGVFHSHPAAPNPSHWDLEYMRFNPCVWVIDGIVGTRHKMKAFQMIKDQVFPVRILYT